jgi:hypothetical protein
MVDLDAVVDDGDDNALALCERPGFFDIHVRINHIAVDFGWRQVPLQWVHPFETALLHEFRVAEFHLFFCQQFFGDLKHLQPRAFGCFYKIRIRCERQLVFDLEFVFFDHCQAILFRHIIFEFDKKVFGVQHHFSAVRILQHPPGKADIVIFLQGCPGIVALAGTAGRFEIARGHYPLYGDAGFRKGSYLFHFIHDFLAGTIEGRFVDVLVAFGADGDHVGAFHQIDGFAFFAAEFYFVHGCLMMNDEMTSFKPLPHPLPQIWEGMGEGLKQIA